MRRVDGVRRQERGEQRERADCEEHPTQRAFGVEVSEELVGAGEHDDAAYGDECADEATEDAASAV